MMPLSEDVSTACGVMCIQVRTKHELVLPSERKILGREMPRVVLNRQLCSVFDLSYEGWMLYSRLVGQEIFAKDNGPKAVQHFEYYKSPDFIEAERLSAFDLDRTNPSLVETVETLGSGAAGGDAELEIVEIPEGVSWCKHGYDGHEWIVAMGRIW